MLLTAQSLSVFGARLHAKQGTT